MSTPFEDGLASAQTEIVGYATTAIPVVVAVAIAFLGVKYARKIISRL